jgi:pyruvate/2-oxoglutarate dehydrogenase complex dihydrolipoamide acyltransferase (E2) component
VPYDLIKADPNYASVFITNLGSIKLNAAYHHLSNWGTNSVFVIIGEKGRKPVFHEDGTFEMHTMLSVGITLDERIADGYYYSGTVALVKELLEHPYLLEMPADTPVEYAIKR